MEENGVQLQINVACHTIDCVVLGRETSQYCSGAILAITDYKRSSANGMCGADVKCGLNCNYCSSVSGRDNGSTELELALVGNLCMLAREGEVCGSLHAH
jgi:hypothetical protein